MAEFYKFEIGNWNEGTATMNLEQEAAYLRVVNAIRLADQPITFNKFALCGMWRCNERKAKRLLDELIALGKLRIEGGRIVNDKAVEDASNLRRLRTDRASAGSRGGIESGKSRSKALKNNNTGEAIASTREEKRREDIKEDTNVSSKSRASRLPADWILPKAWGDWAIAEGMAEDRVRHEADQFRDYWLGVAGAKALKVNWKATWQKWARTAMDRAAERKMKFAPQSKAPEIGETRTTPSGKQMMWTGAVGQWAEVRE